MLEEEEAFEFSKTREQQMFTMPVFLYLLENSVILVRTSHEICRNFYHPMQIVGTFSLVGELA